MRWGVLLIGALLFVAIDSSLMQALRFGSDINSAVQPQLTPCLAVFVCLMAPRTTAIWACWLLGLLIDLRLMIPFGAPETIRIIGPNALGYVFGAVLLLQLRSMVFRRKALTIGVMTAAFMIAASVVAVTIYVIQSWYPGGPLYWGTGSASAELISRFLTAVYSGLIAMPIGWLLVKSAPLWGFPHIQRVRTYR